MHRRVLAVAGTALAVSLLGSGLAGAQPLPGTGSSDGGGAIPGIEAQTLPLATARIDRVDMLTDRRAAVWVDSPAMGRAIQVQVLLPAAQAVSRPTLYMLDGVSAGKESDYKESTWTQKTDIVNFFADKQVNVVLPVGGSSSYYTDWNVPGLNKGYKPVQPISFSHKLHAGDVKIDCKYCHLGTETSRKAGVPPVNVCMNCHKVVRT